MQTRFNLNAILKGQPWKVLSTTALSFGVMVFLRRCYHFCKPSPRKDVWSLRVSICSCALSALAPLCFRQIISLLLVRFLARLFVRCYPVSHYWLIYYEQALWSTCDSKGWEWRDTKGPLPTSSLLKLPLREENKKEKNPSWRKEQTNRAPDASRVLEGPKCSFTLSSEGTWVGTSAGFWQEVKFIKELIL